MFYNFIAVMWEISSLLLVASLIYGKAYSKGQIIGGALFAISYAAINAYVILDIPVLVHCLIYSLFLTVLLNCWRDALFCGTFAALTGYSTLIYFQAIILYWIPAEWLASYYMFLGLLINILVFVIVSVIVLIFKKRSVDIRYCSLKTWQKLMVFFIEIGIIAFCCVVKPILESEYHINSQLLMAFIAIVLIVLLLIERESCHLKNKERLRKLADYEMIVAKDREVIHDYNKTIKLLSEGTTQKDMEPYLQEAYNHSAYHMLPSIVRRVIHLYDDILVEQGIELKLNIDQGIPVFKIKERDLAIILTNLIENAIEAVQEFPRSDRWIGLYFQKHERWARISVVNPSKNTQEITPEITKKGFTTKGSGHGEGLYIVNRLIKKNAGELRLFFIEGEFHAIVELYFN